MGTTTGGLPELIQTTVRKINDSVDVGHYSQGTLKPYQDFMKGLYELAKISRETDTGQLPPYLSWISHLDNRSIFDGWIYGNKPRRTRNGFSLRLKLLSNIEPVDSQVLNFKSAEERQEFLIKNPEWVTLREKSRTGFRSYDVVRVSLLNELLNSIQQAIEEHICIMRPCHQL